MNIDIRMRKLAKNTEFNFEIVYVSIFSNFKMLVKMTNQVIFLYSLSKSLQELTS